MAEFNFNDILQPKKSTIDVIMDRIKNYDIRNELPPTPYNNPGQFNPNPRPNQPSPVTDVAQTTNRQTQNPIARFLRTPAGFVQSGGENLSPDNPFRRYYTSKWLKPTINTQLQAQQWEQQQANIRAQQEALKAKAADNYTIDQTFIDKLDDKDPIKPYLRPGMTISTDTLYRYGTLNQKQNATEADAITDVDRESLMRQYGSINIYKPDGTIDPDALAYRNAVVNTIYTINSKKQLGTELSRLNALRVPKALGEVKEKSIVANTDKTEAQTEGQEIENKYKPELRQSQIDKNNRSNTGGSKSGSGSSAQTKADKDFLNTVDREYKNYVTQQSKAGMGSLLKNKQTWVRENMPNQFDRWNRLVYGETLNPKPPSGPMFLPGRGYNQAEWNEAASFVRKYKGTAAALKSIWGTNVNPNIVKALLDRYNNVNKTNYTLAQFRDRFIK